MAGRGHVGCDPFDRGVSARHPVGHDAESLHWTVLIEMADYGIRFLGLPWSHAASLVWCGRLIGCLVLAGGIATLVCGNVLRRPIGGIERIGLALLMFSLAAGSRSTVAPELTMPIRYGIFGGLAQVGLLLANSPRLERLRDWGWPRSLRWALLPIVAVFIVQQIAGGRAAVAVAARYRRAYRDFADGRWDGDADHYAFPKRADADRALAFMRAQGIYGN